MRLLVKTNRGLYYQEPWCVGYKRNKFVDISSLSRVSALLVRWVNYIETGNIGCILTAILSHSTLKRTQGSELKFLTQRH